MSSFWKVRVCECAAPGAKVRSGRRDNATKMLIVPCVCVDVIFKPFAQTRAQHTHTHTLCSKEKERQ